MAIAIRKPDEIAKLKRAGEIVGKTLQYLQNTVKTRHDIKRDRYPR